MNFNHLFNISSWLPKLIIKSWNLQKDQTFKTLMEAIALKDW